MKASLLAILAFVVCFVSGAAVSEHHVGSSGMIRRQSNATCGNITDLVPFFQLQNANTKTHLYTIEDSEVTAAVLQGGGAWAFTVVAAVIFPTPEPSTVPLFELINEPATAFFYTTSNTERSNALTAGGYSVFQSGIVGYIYPTQVCGSVPLFRVHLIGQNTDYIYTTSAAVRDNAVLNQGFTDEGIAGYVIELASGINIA